MFNVGGGEVIVVLLLALLLLGPEKLPEASRRIGKFLAEVRRVTTGFQEEVRSAMDLGPEGSVTDLLESTTSGPSLTPPAGSPSASTAASVPDPGSDTGHAPRTTTAGPGAAFVADLGRTSDPDSPSSGAS